MIGILGAGSWGTALADVVVRRGAAALLWSDDPEIAAEINQRHTNEKRLPGVALAEGVRATSNLDEVAAAAQLLILAVGVAKVEAVVRALGGAATGRHMIVHAIGSAAGSAGRISELVRSETPVKRVGALAGPALAQDLAERRPCAVVAASTFDEVVVRTRAALESPPTLRVYRSSDLAGVELASALTTAYTLAFGLADGIGLGAGPKAVLLCRVLAEATRLGVASGAKERTFAGLAGLGNLMVRASSERSEDYQLGLMFGRGETVKRQETPGTRAALSLVPLAKRLGVRAPILDALSAVLQGVSVRDVIVRLMEGQSEEE